MAHDLRLKKQSSAYDHQVGGDHYKHCTIQPAHYAEANKLSFLDGSIVKRATRWRHEGGKGIEDLRKIIHEAELLIAEYYPGGSYEG